MALRKFRPYSEIQSMRESMSSLLDRFFSDFFRFPESEELGGQTFSPAVDIKETPKEYIVTAEIPGISKKDIEIEISDNILTIKGERKMEKEEKGETYHRVERSYGSFCRSFTLPAQVEAEKIEANFKDGLLNIKIPKAEEKIPKKIEIKD